MPCHRVTGDLTISAAKCLHFLALRHGGKTSWHWYEWRNYVTVNLCIFIAHTVQWLTIQTSIYLWGYEFRFYQLILFVHRHAGEVERWMARSDGRTVKSGGSVSPLGLCGYPTGLRRVITDRIGGRQTASQPRLKSRLTMSWDATDTDGPTLVRWDTDVKHRTASAAATALVHEIQWSNRYTRTSMVHFTARRTIYATAGCLSVCPSQADVEVEEEDMTFVWRLFVRTRL